MTGFNDVLYYESSLLRRGYNRPAGIDEAGRGPLAGPVVAAAVIMPAGITIPGVKDSKKMTEKAREVAFSVITETAAAIGVGVVSHKIIDKSNILVSSLEAMKLAVLAIDPAPEFLLVDGIHKIPILIPQQCIIKGDQLCHSISAASIIAKVYRDRIMLSYDMMFPEYGFSRNKGYGTAEHLKAIREKGACPIHRSTFRGVR
ncbi:MAG: ribonuclease HII [Deltaproteobacteria bacterium]|nr:ribonuclease HII [Deltaproteobacteria bacterium]